jgi:hypothetical protein
MSSSIPPTSSATPRIDAQTYPGVGQVPDSLTQIALRLVHDLILMLSRKSVPTRGTIAPDQRPVLTPQQKGFLFWASDFDRVFVWSGLAWQDAPAQPVRGGVSWFLQTRPPGPGWARCDGRAASITSPTAELRSLSTPIVDSLNGLDPWIRL